MSKWNELVRFASEDAVVGMGEKLASGRILKAAASLADAAHDVIHTEGSLDMVHTKLRDAVIEYDNAVAAISPHNAQ